MLRYVVFCGCMLWQDRLGLFFCVIENDAVVRFLRDLKSLMRMYFNVFLRKPVVVDGFAGSLKKFVAYGG